ncbi:chitin deacetylase [Linnemannia exigua]|uniref:chitin deacetylase n=1 Tax=Linnemannia exigua TaxID=604196 RepID=A0AAD4H8R9_9FUNG|nr:chitin deacetylase [Linnemannia exigua]
MVKILLPQLIALTAAIASVLAHGGNGPSSHHVRRSNALVIDGGNPNTHGNDPSFPRGGGGGGGVFSNKHKRALTSLEKRAPPTTGATPTGPQHPQTSSCPQKTYTTPIAANAFPTLDCIPFIEDPQVQEWLKLVDFSKVPVFPLSNDGACPTAGTVPADQCWWTCSKCTAPGDVTNCPAPGTWGLTYDDGPSPDSPRLYDNLLAHNQKATLFVVGSRAIANPATLQRAYKEGHQIAIHTWSHPSMTSISNEQIVAELKWTEKAIKSVIGVSPKYWRPPYGDVDNRVRAIATQLGFKTIIWTDGFDTNDWNIPGNLATPQSVIDTFKAWLTKVPTMSTGFIVLEHDLWPQEVDVALTGILPIAYATKGLTMMPVAKCLGDATPYLEGAGTFVGSNTTTTTPTSSVTVSGTMTTGGATKTGTSAATPSHSNAAAGSVVRTTSGAFLVGSSALLAYLGGAFL